MILVPASGRDEPENEKMSELDDEISIIVNNRKLSVKEKVEMYNDVLRRNLIFERRLLHKQEGFENKMEQEGMAEASVSSSPYNTSIEYETPSVDSNFSKINPTIVKSEDELKNIIQPLLNLREKKEVEKKIESEEDGDDEDDNELSE